MSETSQEYNKLQPPQPEFSTKLAEWKETGFDQGAVFVSGVSVRTVEQAARGKMPSTPAHETWGFAEEPHKHLRVNYVLPVLENLVQLQPELVDELKNRLDGGEKRPESWYEKELSTPVALEYAKRYALVASVCDTATECFGTVCDFPTVLSLANRYNSEALDLFQDDTRGKHPYEHPRDIEIDADKEVIERVTQQFSPEEIAKNIELILRQRGALIYLNASVYKQGEVTFDPEGNTGMAILSTNGLPSEVISGVELLG